MADETERPKKREDFSEWYNEIVEKSGLIDKRYPIKGMDVWRPYGWSIMRAIDSFTRAEMERTGHDEVMFPVLIPRREFMKEADQIKGFGGEVYWVTKGGENDLDEPLVVRPTSETAMYHMYSLWIRSHKDLPLKLYQIVQVFRYETKQTRSFLRVRQIHFFESHTAHVDYEDAEAQIKQDLEIWGNLSDKLCIPTMLHKRPDWDKFPGAHYSVAADAMLPELKTLQVGTFHHYRDNFAKAYDIEFEGEDEQKHHAHQTTYGMSERLMGALVAVHGDDHGLMVPPDLAPYQAAVVPVVFKGSKEEVHAAAETQAARLREAGYRVTVDTRDESAGFKFNDWEMRGVPVRIEIGPRDIENNVAVLARRDQSGQKNEKGKPLKHVVGLDDLPKAFGEMLAEYKQALKDRAAALMREGFHEAKDLDAVRDGPGVHRVGWCGDDACGKEIETRTEKSVLGVPVDAAFSPEFAPASDLAGAFPAKGYQGQCVVCGKGTSTPVDVARTY